MNRTGLAEWFWLWREFRPFMRLQVLSLVCVFLASACTLAGPLLMKWLVDDVLTTGGYGSLGLATGLFLLIIMGRSALASLGSLLNTIGVQQMTFRTRARILRHVQTLSAAFHARTSVGDLVQCLERDVTLIGDLGSDMLPAFVRVITGFVMSLALMIYLDWRVACIVMPLLPLIGYLRHRYRGILLSGAEAVREATGRQSSLLHELLTGAIQIQLLGAETRASRRYARLSLDTMQRQIAHRKQELTFALISMTIIGVGMALITGYGGARVFQGSLTIGGLVAFTACIDAIFMPMTTAVDLYARSNKVRVSIRRLMAIEQTTDVIADGPDVSPLGASPGLLACQDVSFDYVSGQPALRGVDLEVRAGERVAIVGESGCGKSSLLKLVPRLYEPRTGRIAIDGRDIRTISLRSLRGAISLVPQDPFLFQGTLRENLRYASPHATAEEIEQVAWIACLTDVVARLPCGWDTELGPLGVGLSGGEKQRLAIARALLQQRPILILDEATSALDDATEHQLLERLTDWATGRTIILVSHRLAGAQWADRVIVLSRGEVVEDGTHEVLFRPDTRYGALWRSRTPVIAVEPPPAPEPVVSCRATARRSGRAAGWASCM